MEGVDCVSDTKTLRAPKARNHDTTALTTQEGGLNHLRYQSKVTLGEAELCELVRSTVTKVKPKYHVTTKQREVGCFP
jgi:hypothetical protein